MFNLCWFHVCCRDNVIYVLIYYTFGLLCMGVLLLYYFVPYNVRLGLLVGQRNWYILQLWRYKKIRCCWTNDLGKYIDDVIVCFCYCFVDQLIWNQLFAYVFGFVVCIIISPVRFERWRRHMFTSLPALTRGVANGGACGCSARIKIHFWPYWNKFVIKFSVFNKYITYIKFIDHNI